MIEKVEVTIIFQETIAKTKKSRELSQVDYFLSLYLIILCYTGCSLVDGHYMDDDNGGGSKWTDLRNSQMIKPAELGMYMQVEGQGDIKENSQILGLCFCQIM